MSYIVYTCEVELVRKQVSWYFQARPISLWSVITSIFVLFPVVLFFSVGILFVLLYVYVFFCYLGKDEWTMIVEQLGLTPKEILFLKRRTTNPADAALAYASQKFIISVGSLYDLLNENRLPMLADFL